MARAFSLIELLVAVIIIAILIGLAVPALSKARESARQMSCSANLHSFGTALGTYRSDHRAYPLVSEPYMDLHEGWQSVFAPLSGYMEAAYPQIRDGVVETQEPYLCPADPGVGEYAGGSYEYYPSRVQALFLHDPQVNGRIQWVLDERSTFPIMGDVFGKVLSDAATARGLDVAALEDGWHDAITAVPRRMNLFADGSVGSYRDWAVEWELAGQRIGD